MASGNRSSKKPKKTAVAQSFNPALLHEAMMKLIRSRSLATGQITIPAVPAMIDEYVQMCSNVFTDIGRRFSADEIAHAKELLSSKLVEAFEASPRSNVIISFNSLPGTRLNYEIKGAMWPVARAYEHWLSTRTPPLFGTEPDARIWTLVSEISEPKGHRILDVGAGTGRNALAVARRGHPVDVVELTPKFADTIRSDAQHESLDVRVIQRDIFETTADLHRDYRLILLSEVVSDFRTPQQLRGVFELAAECLAPQGRLVFNLFLAKQGFTPDRAARELGQQCYTSIFTRHELETAAAGLPLELIADDSVYEYEKAHLPEGAWPPTGWYADWVRGLDLFGAAGENCPIEMRWVLYEKTS
jgi:SAM-dependent methyltransferase